MSYEYLYGLEKKITQEDYWWRSSKREEVFAELKKSPLVDIVIEGNSLLSHTIARFASQQGFRVLHLYKQESASTAIELSLPHRSFSWWQFVSKRLHEKALAAWRTVAPHLVEKDRWFPRTLVRELKVSSVQEGAKVISNGSLISYSSDEEGIYDLSIRDETLQERLVVLAGVIIKEETSLTTVQRKSGVFFIPSQMDLVDSYAIAHKIIKKIFSLSKRYEKIVPFDSAALPGGHHVFERHQETLKRIASHTIDDAIIERAFRRFGGRVVYWEDPSWWQVEDSGTLVGERMTVERSEYPSSGEMVREWYLENSANS